MIIVGGLIFLFGLVDLIGSFAGFDLWGQWIGVDLPEVIWRVTAWIEMGLGAILFKLGSRTADDED